MAVIEGIEVGRIGKRKTGLVGVAIDAPKTGATADTFALRITGWALGEAGPPVAVQAVSPGRIHAAAPVDLPSPDVAARFPNVPGSDRCRWSLMLDTLRLDPSFAVRLRIGFEGSERVKLAELRGRRRAVAPDYPPRRQPLMLTSLARCGTTLLMRLLSEHPAIVAYRHYPYEIRGAKYWLHVFRTLAAPADPTTRVGQPNEFDEEPLGVAGNPFYSPTFDPYPAVEAWAGSGYVDELAGFCLRSIDGWYDRVAQSQDQNLGDLRYFAEKGFPDRFPPLFRELYPEAREIFLVRDFRDMVASMVAYNERKGVPDFARRRYDSDDAWLVGIRGGVAALLAGWQQRQATSRLVRYEDLLVEPAAILTDLCAYLGLDASPVTVAGMIDRTAAETPELAGHGTSGSAAASVGRWRRDLPEPFRHSVATTFPDLLRGFGYDGAEEPRSRGAEENGVGEAVAQSVGRPRRGRRKRGDGVD